MIQTALKTIANDLDGFLRRRLKLQDNMVVLQNVVDGTGDVPTASNNKVVLTLANLSVAQTPLSAEIRTDRMRTPSPPLHFELGVLASMFYHDYEEALKMLSTTLLFFHGKVVFTSENTPGLPADIAKISVELVNLTHPELQAVWSTLGTRYRPSAYFKFRLILLSGEELSQIEELPMVKGIGTSH